MPVTALQHFNDDIDRARAIVAHADLLSISTLAQQTLRSDLLRGAWMFSVGALDAYFCDAYTDLVAATASSKSRQPDVELPAWVYDIKFSLRAILEDYENQNWRWRMAARKMMERENVTSLEAIQRLFNKFFRVGNRFFGDQLDAWMSRSDAKKRLFGFSPSVYRAMNQHQRNDARKLGNEQFKDRFGSIFQRRHDCIHNCDRPRVSPQPLVRGLTVLKVIEDIEFLVRRCDEHMNAEFRVFLDGIGCTPSTIAQAGY